MKKVFITRNLKETDFFKIALEKVGFSVFGNSLIKFELMPIAELPDFDWLFFYSKNAARFFFQQIDLQTIKNKKIGTIGKSTADFIINNYHLKVDFIGTGEPIQTSKLFIQLIRKEVVLFPRAENSKKSIQKQLGDAIFQKDLIVYKNQPKSKFEIVDVDILVFTSPMNAKAYFNTTALKKNQKIIAIGNTTANALSDIGIENIIIAKEPSEKGIVQAILSDE